ncbi:MAG: alpha/beta fold hydrolase [Dehalococcoidia bacterium]|nr:alpha/beta fold hydrolase [Dehalococcoidia bacterium]
MSKRRRLFFLAALGAIGTAWSYSKRALQRWENVELDEVEKPGRMAPVGGVDMHYVEAGSGPVLLLLHGLGASTFSFRRLLPLLAPHMRAVAIDLKGFGFSERPPDGDYSLSAHARAVRDFMDVMGIEKASVLGHSLGGAVAMHVATAFPERVERLILVSSASQSEVGRGVFGARFLRLFLPLVAMLTLQNRRFRSLSLRSALYDPASLTDEVMEGYIRPTRIRGHLHALGELMVDRAKDPRIDPSAIRQPTLIIWGSGDRWLPPSNGRRLERQIPDARMVVVDRAGHLVPEEQPEATAEAIIDFLKR